MSNKLITLEEAKITQPNPIDQQVIDLFQRNDFILSALTFDAAISPGTGGSTLVYGYTQLKTPSTAEFRNINEEYTANMAIREPKTANAKIFGGRFKIDRVIDDTSGSLQELAFQMEEKIKGATNLFDYMFINGDSTKNPKEFDGLATLLKDTETEYKLATPLDISDSEKMGTNADLFIDTLDSFLSTMENPPSMFFVNKELGTKFKGIARRAGYYERTADAFGRTVNQYNGIPIVELDKYWDGEKSVDIIPTETDGTSAIYAVYFGMNGVHGISPQGDKLIKTYAKDKTDVGVMREGEIEAIMGIALKNSRNAGVLRGIKVKNTTARTLKATK